MGNKGFEAALAAVEMASLKEAVSRHISAVSENKTRAGKQIGRKLRKRKRSRS
jgi:hypothetical protein